VSRWKADCLCGECTGKAADDIPGLIRRRQAGARDRVGQPLPRLVSRRRLLIFQRTGPGISEHGRGKEFRRLPARPEDEAAFRFPWGGGLEGLRVVAGRTLPGCPNPRRPKTAALRLSIASV